MWIVNRILMAVFDAIYAVLGAVHPGFALFVISGVFGVAALLVIRYCSNQTAVGLIKDRINANLLAIKLYKDELRVMFRALPRILWATAKLQAHMIPPLLVMIVPMVLVCAQMASRHEWRPLRVGERAVLAVVLNPDAPDSALDITPRLPPEVTVDHFIRSTAVHQVNWYVQASAPGRYTLVFPVGDGEVTKELVVGDGFERVSPRRHTGGLWDGLLYPTEKPIEADSMVQMIEITLPGLDNWFYGSMWWIIWFLVLSMVIALIFKPWLKVKL
jgi:hypothetical protein